MFGLTPADLLGLSVIAAIITTVGNLFALILREIIFTRSFERWKERRSLRFAYQRYRDPIVLSGRDLQYRLVEICRLYPTTFLRSELLEQPSAQAEKSTDDSTYYLRYKLVSSVYRLGAFLGWLELYRQDVTFLNTGKRRANESLERLLADIRRDLADSRLNTAKDRTEWSDHLIFREEQRAVGAAMITGVGPQRMVMGYGEFMLLFDGVEDAELLPWWLRTTKDFLLDLGDERDFRKERLELLERHIGALIGFLDRTRALSNRERFVRERTRST